MADDLDENYARANYHSAQKWGTRPALVLVDFAQAYFDEAYPLFGVKGVAQHWKMPLALHPLHAKPAYLSFLPK